MLVLYFIFTALLVLLAVTTATIKSGVEQFLSDQPTDCGLWRLCCCGKQVTASRQRSKPTSWIPPLSLVHLQLIHHSLLLLLLPLFDADCGSSLSLSLSLFVCLLLVSFDDGDGDDDEDDGDVSATRPRPLMS